MAHRVPPDKAYLPWPIRASQTVYQILLLAYPAPFRHAYGRQMLQVFSASCEETYRQRGMVGVLWLWGDSLINLGSSVFLEQLEYWEVPFTHKKPPVEVVRTVPAAFGEGTTKQPHPAEKREDMSSPHMLLKHILVGGKHTRDLPMPLPDRFDRRAQRALRLADEEARVLRHNYIGTEHVLLGLLREGDGVAVTVLRQLGVDLNQARTAIVDIIGRGKHETGPSSQSDLGLTPRVRSVTALASDEARRLNQPMIGSEHLLLGLIAEGEGIAAGVLEHLGVRLHDARRQVLLALQDETRADDLPGEPGSPSDS